MDSLKHVEFYSKNKFEELVHLVGVIIRITFHEHPSSGCRGVPRGQTDKQTDMMKLIVAFRNFGNVSKNAANSAMADESLYI